MIFLLQSQLFNLEKLRNIVTSTVISKCFLKKTEDRFCLASKKVFKCFLLKLWLKQKQHQIKQDVFESAQIYCTDLVEIYVCIWLQQCD